MQQFLRGYGKHIDWLSDPAILRAARLEIDTHLSLASSKVIGVFGSVLHPQTLFRQEPVVGVYSLYSKEHFFLSRDSDFFGAGLEYSTCDEFPRPGTANTPLGDMSIPAQTKHGDAQSEVSKAYHALPSNISHSPLPDRPTASQTLKPEPESSPYFSPLLTDHSPSFSDHHDPRIHTVNIPIHLGYPTRSRSYSSSTSPAPMDQTSSLFSIKKRSYSLRNPGQASETHSLNIVPILPEELEYLTRSQTMLLVDFRAFHAYAQSRIVGAINVCIPSVLLKRSSFSLDDILKRIISQDDRDQFAKWKDVDSIVIYDTDSLQIKESCRLATLANKFIDAGFERKIYGLIGPTPY